MFTYWTSLRQQLMQDPIKLYYSNMPFYVYAYNAYIIINLCTMTF